MNGGGQFWLGAVFSGAAVAVFMTAWMRNAIRNRDAHIEALQGELVRTNKALTKVSRENVISIDAHRRHRHPSAGDIA